MHEIDIFLIALLVLLFAAVSRKAVRGVVTAPMVFSAAGLIYGWGSLGFGALSVSASAMRLLAEVTLALTLFLDAARIDLRRLRRDHGAPVRLLLVAMPLSMALGAAFALLLFPGIGPLTALIAGIILAPTDAALGQAVIVDRTVPGRVRQTLNVESGLNDGLAFPVLLIAATIATQEGRGGGTAWAGVLGGQIGLGLASGVAIGAGAALLLRWCAARGWMESAYLRISGLAVALLAYTGAEMIGGNGFISAFAAGASLGALARSLRTEIDDFGETEGDLLTLLVFFLFAALLLPEAVGALGWRDVVYALLSLTVVRMVPVALSLIGGGLRSDTQLFLGWFGPRGLASIIYLLLLMEDFAVPGLGDIAPAILLTIALSVALHGMTAAPLARLYGRHLSRADADGAEHAPAFAHRLGRHAREAENRDGR